MNGINIKDATELLSYAASHVIGWNPYETWHLLKKYASKLNKDEKWLDWILDSWPLQYYNEIESTIKINLYKKEIILPQVIIYDNTLENESLDKFKIKINNKQKEYIVPIEYSERNNGVIVYYEKLKRTLFQNGNVKLFDGACARLYDFEETTKRDCKLFCVNE